METDLDFYTRSMVEALQAARRATCPEARRAHERLANTFAIQVRRLQATPTMVTPPQLRLRPLQLAA
jgi:hypothetical protein